VRLKEPVLCSITLTKPQPKRAAQSNPRRGAVPGLAPPGTNAAGSMCSSERSEMTSKSRPSPPGPINRIQSTLTLADIWTPQGLEHRTCCFCGTVLEETFLDLGSMPLANTYAPSQEAARRQPRYPLHTKVCSRCLLVQHDTNLDSSQIFSEYAYFSSYSQSWLDHARRYVHMACARFDLSSASQVIEIASNDGYLLQHFLPLGIPVLGVDPAHNVAEAARRVGVPTEVRFFGIETALEMRERTLSADLMIANNVLAHMPDINNMIAGIKILLKPAGVFTAEFPHLLRLIQDAQFDTIYHEHFFYYSLLSMESILKRHNLRIFDVEELPSHGGSLRIFVCHDDSPAHGEGTGLRRVRAAEKKAGLHRVESYSGLAARILRVKSDFMQFLADARRQGRRVAAFGAAAKGSTLLNFCGVDETMIDYVADEIPYKIGKFLPGSCLPILSPEIIPATRPDFILILAWNHKEEIMRKLGYIREWGGRFVIALPELQILD
jgi:SAM-dependent methyltransferase